MRFLRYTISILAIFVLMVGCAKKQTVQPPVEEVIVPETEEAVVEVPETPPKPEFKLDRIFFDFDKSDIGADASEILNNNAEMLKLYPELKIVIEGHCCHIGTAEYNLALGERRAKAARDYLGMLGIDARRLSIISYGEEKPLDPNDLPKNRRSEFVAQ